VALPWYCAMYMRHGPAFTDRLIFHDMWKRAMVHVHDTNAGVDVTFRYFVWQLGYGLFPWTGLVPVGLVWWLRRRQDGSGSGRGDASVFFAVWFVFAFALFAAMLTKFHHYILPAVPPAAILTGIVLDRMTQGQPLARKAGTIGYALLVGGGTLLAMYGLFRLFPGMLSGYKPEDADAREPSLAPGIPLLLAGIASIVAGIWRFGDNSAPEADNQADTPMRRQHAAFEEPLLGAVAIGAAIVVALVAFDLVNKPSVGTPGQTILMYLFTYNYTRSWPDSLEFTGMIKAFSIATILLMLAFAVQRIRKHAVVIMAVVAVAWSAWGLNIYLVKTSPHWGQREIMVAYYALRANPSEQLIAYQMNWKGENFYTSNRIPAFVSSGQKFKDWIAQERGKGVTTMFFVTEPGRSKSLQGELGEGVASFEKMTDKRVNNKFAIFRAVFGVGGEKPPVEAIDTGEDTEG